MFIPKKWKSETIVYSNSNGWSPAEVTMLNTGSKCLYLKSIDIKYSSTTYSVKREKEVMQWLDDRLIVPKIYDSGFEDNREFLLMSELKGTYIDNLRTDPQ